MPRRTPRTPEESERRRREDAEYQHLARIRDRMVELGINPMDYTRQQLLAMSLHDVVRGMAPNNVPQQTPLSSSSGEELLLRPASRRPKPAPSTLRYPRREFPVYKTDEKGYIINMREGYVRPKKGGPGILMKGREDFKSNQSLNEKARDFYDTVRDFMVYKKPAYGWGVEETFSNQTGRFIFVYSESERDFVGCFEMREDGNSNFFYIKTEANSYKTILKEMLIAANARVRTNFIILRLKGDKLADSLKILFPGTFIQEQDLFTFKIPKTLLESLAIGTDITNIRWQDLGEEW